MPDSQSSEPGFESPFDTVSKIGHFRSLHWRPCSLSCINEYLAVDSGGNVSDLSLARNSCLARMLPGEAELLSEWTGLPRDAKSVKRFERSNGLDTALYKNNFFFYKCVMETCRSKNNISSGIQSRCGNKNILITCTWPPAAVCPIPSQFGFAANWNMSSWLAVAFSDWLGVSVCDVWHFMSFTRRSTPEGIVDVVSEQTKHTGIIKLDTLDRKEQTPLLRYSLETSK